MPESDQTDTPGEDSTQVANLETSFASSHISESSQNFDADRQSIQHRKFLLKKKCKNILILNGVFYKVDFAISSAKQNSIAAVCCFCPESKLIRGSLQSRSNFVSHLKVLITIIRSIKRFPSIHYQLLILIFISVFTILQSQHQNEYIKYIAERDRAVRQNRLSKLKLTSSKTVQDAYEKNLTNFILSSMNPLSVAESREFRKLIDGIFSLDLYLDLITLKTFNYYIFFQIYLWRRKLKSSI